MILRAATRGVQSRVFMAWTILLVVGFGGGSSWPNVASLLYVRPLLAFIGSLALLLYYRDMKGFGTAALLMAALATWIILQLIPLPPSLWRHLPGHDLVAQISDASGMPSVWRPISISPDATLSALLACIPALTALAVVATLNGRTRRSLIDPLLIVILISMVLGVVQIASGDASFMLFRKSNLDTAVGLFANRNHFALLLAAGLPLLSAWSFDKTSRSAKDIRPFLAGIGAIFILVMIIATGSRAGLALSIIGVILAALIRWRNINTPVNIVQFYRRKSTIVFMFFLVFALVILGFTIGLKGVAFERLFRTTSELGAEKRLTLSPIIFSNISTYFPFGSGFGTFDHMFRQIEPDWALTPTYFNHAHNEVLEFLVTGGFPAGLLLIGFAWFVARLCWVAVKSPPGLPTAYAQAGASVIVLAMLASLVDYPLRTPLIDVVVVFAIALTDTTERRSQPTAVGNQKAA